MDVLQAPVSPNVFLELAFAARDNGRSFIAVGLLMLVVIFISKSVSGKTVLPGVPEYRSFLGFGPTLIALIQGMPELLSRMMAVSSEGISCANLMYPDEIASRMGDPRSMSYSPFSTLSRLIGGSLFDYVGKEHVYRRNIFIREFNSAKSNARKFDTMAKNADWHIDKLADGNLIGDISNITTHADDFATSMWGELLYGNPAYYLGGDVVRLSDILLQLAASSWSPIKYAIQLFLGLVALGAPTRSERKVKASVDKIVEDAIQKLEEFEQTNPDAAPKTIRNLSIESGGSRTGPLSGFAREFAKLSLFGGHHSIGSIVTWSLVELDRHPECLAKLMQEIESIDTLTFTHVNSRMPYLEALVLEIERLYPVVHATLRVMQQEANLMSGKQHITLKSNMLVYFSFLSLQTSEKYWGPDAKEFNPDRFLGGRNKERPYLPFGYGPRSCVGFQIGLLASKIYLVKLLQKYEVALKEHDHQMIVCALIESKKPVGVQVTRRV